MAQFSGPIATSVALPSALLRVTHHVETAIGAEPKAIVLRQPNVTPDTLTRVEVWPDQGLSKTVLVLWERQPAADGIGLLLVDGSDTLFIGAATFAAAVRLTTEQVIGAHEVFLFWSFRHIPGYVLELGELACFLRTESGDIIGEAPVDPPYEMFESFEGIRLESAVMGTQWLRFPEARDRAGA